jgi:TolA-binding protein
MRIVFIPSMLVLALSANIATAQDATLEPVVNAANAITQSARSSQVTVDTIADTTQERIQQYKQIMRQIEGLEVYTQQLQKQIDNQNSEKAELNVSIDEVSVVERQISPLMLRMIAALEAFISLDVPFLGTERSERIANLEDLMERADVDVSEKFRRVMEAYQIEADYGRNIEAYNGVMDINGQAQDVEFLRIGRLVLIYKTRDGSQLGVWDQQQKAWQALDRSYSSGVQEAIRIARKQLAPDLLMLPVTSSGRGE